MDTAVMTKIEEKVIDLKYKEPVFWSERYNNRGGKIYTLLEPELRSFLKKSGYRNFEEEPIRLVGNIAYKVTPEQVFKFVLNYIENLEEPRLEAAFIKQGETLLIKNKAIIISLPDCELPHLRSTSDTSYHFYSNGIVKVKAASEFEIISYEKAKGFIWDREIKNREFKIFNDDEIERSMFCQFVQNITNDEEHCLSLSSAMGYLIHPFKDERKPVCIIINDENLIDEGKPEGGTGKGIIVKAVAEIVEKAMYNGKNSDFINNKFAYQNVKDTTAIISIDDAPRNFDFEALFSVLTDDMPVEKKHRPVKIIPYERSPKFVITTNYTIKGNSSSYKRRRFDTFLTNYYSAGKTPSDDFGCEFFRGWDQEQWQLFDFFMMSCARLFLSGGLIPYENEGLRLKMLKNETAPEFYDLMEEEFNEKHLRYYYKEVINRLCEIGGNNFDFLNGKSKIVVQWVKNYTDFKGIPINHDRSNGGFYFELLGSPGEDITVKKVQDVEF